MRKILRHWRDCDQSGQAYVRLARASHFGVSARAAEQQGVQNNQKELAKAGANSGQTDNVVEFLARAVSIKYGIALAVPRVSKLLSDISHLEHVPVHGDIHEDQLLVESIDSTGISCIHDWKSLESIIRYTILDLVSGGDGYRT
jgi:hypothetical protein